MPIALVDWLTSQTSRWLFTGITSNRAPLVEMKGYATYGYSTQSAIKSFTQPSPERIWQGWLIMALTMRSGEGIPIDDLESWIPVNRYVQFGEGCRMATSCSYSTSRLKAESSFSTPKGNLLIESVQGFRCFAHSLLAQAVLPAIRCASLIQITDYGSRITP